MTDKQKEAVELARQGHSFLLTGGIERGRVKP